ncbi:T9SS type A sorting domain-containing protein [Arcicella aquatica]|uniref:T9SS type A sorting domain-containing protein n=1 Tax=Arcicella aquatica TaxID=217141 RepID=A0ABU5QSF7_9BACT|nr:T9SS type A sorting domain-containing protein [Arcicella aquatica]MEA5260040.1 T9SS type A sorting domain-containing protein [Arcicella aquatica]
MLRNTLVFTCLLFFIFNVKWGGDVNAQSCVLTPNNSSSNPTLSGNFNWLSPSFGIKWADNNININPITSPFFQSNNANLNYIVFGQNYSYNDGWELLQKNVSLGDANGASISHPYMIFYNRFTGLLRAFLSVNTRGNAYQRANVELYFSNNGVSTGALSTVGYPVALDKVSNKSLHSIVNAKNTPGDWFVAEFPISYDPCTCMNYSELIFKISSTQESKLTGTIVSNGTLVAQDIAPPQDKSVTLGNISVSDVTKLAKNAMETYNSLDKFKTSMLETHDSKWEKIAVDIIARPNPKTGSLQGVISTLKATDPSKSKLETLVSDAKVLGFLKTGLNALPYVGLALSAIDFFTGGGQAAGPQEVKITPMAIKMNSELTGTIVKTDPWSDIIIANPGSNQTSLNSQPSPIIAARKPIYNNTMGVVNLLHTPIVAYRKKSRTGHFLVRQNTYDTRGGKVTTDPYVDYRRTIVDYDFKITNWLSMSNIMVNPAHKMVIQDIKGAIVIEGQISDTDLLKNGLGTGNLQFDYFDSAEKTYGFRTEYADLGCLSRTVAKTSDIWSQGTDGTLSPLRPIDIGTSDIPSGSAKMERADGQMPFRGWEVDKAGIEAQKNRVFIKLIINFKRTDDPNAQNVLWVGKFPVELVERNATTDSPYGYDLNNPELGWNTTSDGCSREFGSSVFGEDNQVFIPATAEQVNVYCSSTQYINNSNASGRVSAEIFQDWGTCTSPTPSITSNPTSISAGQSATLTATGCSGTITWNDGTTGSSKTVNSAGTYNATCTNSGCSASSNGSITISSATVTSCNYSEGQLLTDWFGEIVRAYKCGTKWYAKSDAGSFKPKSWLEATGRFSTSETNCFEQEDPRPAGCAATCTSPTPSITANLTSISAGQSAILTATGCSGTITWNDGTTGSSKTVNSTGTYNATCTNSGCSASSAGSITISSATVTSCNYSEGQLLTDWFGEIVRAYKCGTKWYAMADGGLFKPKSWLEATGRFSTSETNCFEQEDPRPAGCAATCTSPTPSITANLTSISAGQSSTLTATGCSGTITWNDGSTGSSKTVNSTGTYTATCSNSGCSASSAGSITISSATATSCNYTEGQLLTDWFGEIVRAYKCGTKWYAKSDAGSFKPKSWLEGTGRFSTSETNCFEQEDPRLAGCATGNSISINNPSSRKAIISETLDAYQNKEASDRLIVSPNPTDGKVKAEFSIAEAQAIRLSVIDIQGKIISIHDKDADIGYNVLELDLQHLASGTYLIQLHLGNKQLVTKIIKL